MPGRGVLGCSGSERQNIAIAHGVRNKGPDSGVAIGRRMAEQICTARPRTRMFLQISVTTANLLCS